MRQHQNNQLAYIFQSRKLNAINFPSLVRIQTRRNQFHYLILMDEAIFPVLNPLIDLTDFPLSGIYKMPILSGYFGTQKTSSALTVTKRFRKKQLIDKAFIGKPEVISGHGIGGPIPAKISTLNPLVIGKTARLKNVASRAPTARGGFNAIKGLDASLGNEVLKQFNLGFDYRKKILYLQKNVNYGKKTRFVPVPNPH